MVRTLNHRGPDEEGSVQLPGVALAMRRLSIVDLAGGQQPFSNEDGTIQVVANGEIYNFAEVRRELRAEGARVPLALRHRGAGARLRGIRRGLSRPASRHVRAGVVGRPDQDAAGGTRPRRREAALLRADAVRTAARLRDQGAAVARRGEPRGRSRGDRPVPDLRIHHRAADHLQAHSQAAGRPLSALPRRRQSRCAAIGMRRTCRCARGRKPKRETPSGRRSPKRYAAR